MSEKFVQPIIDLLSGRGQYACVDVNGDNGVVERFHRYLTPLSEEEKAEFFNILVLGFLGKEIELQAWVASIAFVLAIFVQRDENKYLHPFRELLEKNITQEIVNEWLKCVEQNEIPRDLNAMKQWRYGSLYYLLLRHLKSPFAEKLYTTIITSACSKEFIDIVKHTKVRTEER